MFVIQTPFPASSIYVLLLYTLFMALYWQYRKKDYIHSLMHTCAHPSIHTISWSIVNILITGIDKSILNYQSYMESFKLAAHGNKPISKSVSLFSKRSSCTFMGGGCQKYDDEGALGILSCSVRNPVNKVQTLEVRNVWQCMRKIQQTEKMKNKIIQDLVVLTDRNMPLKQTQVCPLWAVLVRAQPAGPGKQFSPFLQDLWALQNKKALTYWKKSSGR